MNDNYSYVICGIIYMADVPMITTLQIYHGRSPGVHANPIYMGLRQQIKAV